MLGLLLSRVQGLDPWLTSLFEGHDAAPALFLSSPENDPPAVSVEELTETWRKSLLLKQIEQALSAEVNDGNEGNGPGSVFDYKALRFSMLASKTLCTQGLAGQQSVDTAVLEPTGLGTRSYVVPTGADCDEPVLSLQTYDAGNASTDAAMPASDTVRVGMYPVIGSVTSIQEDMALPVQWRSYLDNYFASSHCWLPISQKHDLLRTAYVLSSGPLNHTNSADVADGDRAFLRAIMTFASYRAAAGMLDMPPDDCCVRSDAAATARETITSLVPRESKHLELGHVRVLLILTLLNIQSDNRQEAWSSVGKASNSMAILTRSYLRRGRPLKDLEEGLKRTMLSCMALDSLVAAWVGVRPYFNRSDILNVGHLPTEGLEEWEPWMPNNAPTQMIHASQPARIPSTFNQYMDLIGFLNDALRLSDGVLTTANLRFDEQNTSEWHKYMRSTQLDVASFGNPHQLNYGLLARSLVHLRQPHLDPEDSSWSALDFCRLLSQADSASQEFIKAVGISFVPPPCQIAMYISRLSIDADAQPQRGFEAELRGLRNCLSELDRSHSSSVVVPHDLQQTQTPPTTILSEVSQFAQPNSLGSSQHDGHSRELSIPTMGTPTRLRSIHQMNSSEHDSALAAMDTVMNVVSSSATAGPAILPNIGLDPMGANLSEDSLFQSLADLDSDDWYAPHS